MQQEDAETFLISNWQLKSTDKNLTQYGQTKSSPLQILHLASGK